MTLRSVICVTCFQALFRLHLAGFIHQFLLVLNQVFHLLQVFQLFLVLLAHRVVGVEGFDHFLHVFGHGLHLLAAVAVLHLLHQFLHFGHVHFFHQLLRQFGRDFGLLFLLAVALLHALLHILGQFLHILLRLAVDVIAQLLQFFFGNIFVVQGLFEALQRIAQFLLRQLQPAVFKAQRQMPQKSTHGRNLIVERAIAEAFDRNDQPQKNADVFFNQCGAVCQTRQ